MEDTASTNQCMEIHIQYTKLQLFTEINKGNNLKPGTAHFQYQHSAIITYVTERSLQTN